MDVYTAGELDMLQCTLSLRVAESLHLHYLLVVMPVAMHQTPTCQGLPVHVSIGIYFVSHEPFICSIFGKQLRLGTYQGGLGCAALLQLGHRIVGQ